MISLWFVPNVNQFQLSQVSVFIKRLVGFLPTVLKKFWQKFNVNIHEDVEDVLFLHDGDGRGEVLRALNTLGDSVDTQV